MSPQGLDGIITAAMKPIKLSTIQHHFSELISDRIGDDREISGFAAADGYQPGDLVFCDDKKLIAGLNGSGGPAAVVTSKELARTISNDDVSVLLSEDVKLAQALIRQRYDDLDLHDSEWPRVHPSAIVHQSVFIPNSVTIGPGVVIGRDVKLGEDVVVQANSVIEEGAIIGNNSIIHAQVFIGRRCTIGNRVRLKPGCVIGADGFGFARDQDKRFHRIPQKGIVVIEDDVVISANSTIDRATYKETRISRGTKIDALCHVAHNVFLDEDCVLVAQSGIAGSTKLGKRVLASGQTGIIDHITIGDDVVLVHRCGIAEDLLEPGMYAGGPAQSFREYTRNISAFKKLAQLRLRVLQLEKELQTLKSKAEALAGD